MQFKYPELLWALFLLLIPIFIHLFQLRRFKKTPFTNVKLLQKVVAESRRSSTLKKWLLLFTRLLLFAALILAFTQPFLANKTALSKKETVIYLDNSFSMQAKQNEGTLLEIAVQDLIETIPRENTFSLFTNEDTYTRVTLKEIQNELLTLQYTHRQLQLDEIWLKAQTLFSDDKNTIK
ncbi:MAG TPA: BatA domain-containing protein, partial [Eudoraea sp.]|nr:BatA domain-containing protein [Eudoraea sp.]